MRTYSVVQHLIYRFVVFLRVRLMQFGFTGQSNENPRLAICDYKSNRLHTPGASDPLQAYTRTTVGGDGTSSLSITGYPTEQPFFAC